MLRSPAFFGVIYIALLGNTGLGGCTPRPSTPSKSSGEPSAGPSAAASDAAATTVPIAMTPAVTMEEFEGDFGPLFPKMAFLKARGIEEVLAISRTPGHDGAGGDAFESLRRYDHAGELVEQRDTSRGKLIALTRYERDDDGIVREILESAIWSTTTTTTLTLDTKGRTVTRTNERERERYSYDGERLMLVEREEGGRKYVKRFRYDGGRIVAIVTEEDGVMVREETREYDEKGREVRRFTKKQQVLGGQVVPLIPVEVNVHYTANGELDFLDIAEGRPLLRRTFRYEQGNLVEEQRRSLVAAVSNQQTTFSYRLRAK